MLALAALSFAASAAALGLKINTPEQVMSSANATISWTSEAGDPAFNIELYKTIFNDRFSIQNNINASSHEVTMTLPQIPAGDGYVYRFTNISDDNDVYATTENFTVIAFDASVASTTTFGSGATGTGSSSGSGSGSGSGSASNTASGADASSTSEPDAAAMLTVSGAVGAVAGIVALFTL
ncbi:hypothetical protein CYLTODRAFT_451804 [Cylindrobasidium torrendii FP15055 ss-10]|uniref:Ser-Thr-rich glycosyl-phosphatidyl-inositol-anchored membrane family-domain-containing protein n=1 Tax=Cylindrobasidium torrendii FP15055 ss-10 TaxID=1314674 RepID=A0A0D7BII6_9AGAR|nr:hypothetical protein CYLTODRAFT_451804 [Cylindrobasidium torrendii FP15055 ss-10]